MRQHQWKGNKYIRRTFIFLLILIMAVAYAIPSFGDDMTAPSDSNHVQMGAADSDDAGASESSEGDAETSESPEGDGGTSDSPEGDAGTSESSEGDEEGALPPEEPSEGDDEGSPEEAEEVAAENGEGEKEEEAAAEEDGDGEEETQEESESEEEDPLFYGVQFRVGAEIIPVTFEVPAEEEEELPEVVSVGEACERSDLAEDLPALLTPDYAGWVETDEAGTALGAEDPMPNADVRTAGPGAEVFTLDGTTPIPEDKVLTTDEVKELPLAPGVTRFFSAAAPLSIPLDSVIIGGNAGEPLKAKIYEDGRQQVWLYDAPQPGYAHENRQFYTQSDDTVDDPSVGWILHLYDANNQKWSVGRGDVSYLSQLSQNSVAPNNCIIYNGVSASPDGRSATVSMTVKYKGSLSDTLDILLTYHIDQGSRQMPVTVKIVNHTSTNFSRMNFIFSEDSYFGGSLYATGNYNALANMVYVWKDSAYGIMSITGSAATPFNNWDADAWDKIRPQERLAKDALRNPTRPTAGDTDAILAAGWRYHNFNAGNTIFIAYYESWTAPSAVHVIPPAGKTVPPDARVGYEFYVINLSNRDIVTSEMKLTSEHGWPAKLTGGSQHILIPRGGTAAVTAELVVPPPGEQGVADGVKDHLTLTVTIGTGQNAKSASGMTTTTINYAMPALNIIKVGQTLTDVTFRVDFINYPPNRHDTTVSILDMDGNVLTDPAPQIKLGFVSGGTFTFPVTALTTGLQYIAEANAQPEIPYPSRTTFKLDPIVKVTFDANGGDTPNPEEKYVVVYQPYGELATTTRAGYVFDGWYTEKVGGTLVTEDTDVTEKSDHTLWAHWHVRFSFTKTKAADSSPLPGAAFNLFVCKEKLPIPISHIHSDYDPGTVNTANSCWVSVNDAAHPVVSDAAGVVDFGGIPDGVYLLREVEAPAGYERPLGWWIISVDAANAGNPIRSITGAGPVLPPAFVGSFGVGDGLQLPNYEKTVLPLTGSVPADWTIVAVLFLGIAALVFAASRKRKNAAGPDADTIQARAGAASSRAYTLKGALPCVLVTVLILTALFGVTATAYASDPKTGSITVHRFEIVGTPADVSKLPPKGKPLAGIPFKVQKVIVDPTPQTSGDVVFTFEDIDYVPDRSGVYKAQTLESNSAGEAVFSGLPLGIYLVREQSAVDAAAPLLVGIPTDVTGTGKSLLYDIDVYLKAFITPPPPPSPAGPSLPGKTVEPPRKKTPPPIVVSESQLTVLPEIQEPEASDDLRDVSSSETPLEGNNRADAWSLLSLIMSLIAIVLSVILIVRWIVRRRSEEDDSDEYKDEQEYEYEDEDEGERNAFIARTLTIVFGILTPVVFLILDDMHQPMVWINKWTPYVGFVFIVHIALFLFYKFRNKEKEPNGSE